MSDTIWRHSLDDVPYDRAECPGCGGRVRSLEFDGYCRSCSERPMPVPVVRPELELRRDAEKRGAWVRSDMLNPAIPVNAVYLQAVLAFRCALAVQAICDARERVA